MLKQIYCLIYYVTVIELSLVSVLLTTLLMVREHGSRPRRENEGKPWVFSAKQLFSSPFMVFNLVDFDLLPR